MKLIGGSALRAEYSDIDMPGDRIVDQRTRVGRAHLDIGPGAPGPARSEEHTSELQSLMRNSYAVFCLKKKQQRQKSTDVSNILNVINARRHNMIAYTMT